MKKILPILALFACTFASCDDSEYEVHQTYFTPTSPQGKILYADQTADSVRVISYDPWTSNLDFESEEWFTITPTKCDFVNSQNVSNTRLDITASPNNTNKIREGLIAINSYYSIGMSVYQMSWLNIQSPIGRTITTDENGEPLNSKEQYCIFEGSVSDKKNQFDIVFTTYAQEASLSTEAEWITLSNDTFAAGTHTVTTICEANPLKEERIAHIKLTSNGITTPITIYQERKRD